MRGGDGSRPASALQRAGSARTTDDLKARRARGRARSMPQLSLEGAHQALEQHGQRAVDYVRQLLPVSRVPTWLLVAAALVAFVWLVVVTVALLWLALRQQAAPADEPAGAEGVSELEISIRNRTRALKHVVTRIPVVSAVYVVVAPYVGLLMGLAGPQVRVLFRFIQRMIPAARKAQGFYIVITWMKRIQQAKVITATSRALRSFWHQSTAPFRAGEASSVIPPR
ncbi:hypothetical protein AB1Y20_018078 [Prymnesium parvum]|uniref:Uncharacterized protein n=1 Tax=Prymnesium parvum TaxID=97485 RepID=A0AB34JPM9_PRYPA